MKHLLFSLFIALVSTQSAWCGELSLVSGKVHNGDVAALLWKGEPLSFGVARFRNQHFYLYPDEDGAVALLPVGLDVPAGDYVVLAALVDRYGQTSSFELLLQVDSLARPVEHLTLPEKMVTPDAESLARIEREHALLREKFALRSPRLWRTFSRPVDGTVSSVFGKRRVMNGIAKSPHSGTDFRSPAGTPVRTVSSGRVVLVADLFYTGQTVLVDHGEGLFSLYAHLSEADVTAGQVVQGGEVLGKVGSTGRSTGAHLHVTVRLLGERVDPLALLSLFRE